MNELSAGLVKHSLCKAEEGRIKDDSTGHVLMAVSRVGPLTNRETQCSQERFTKLRPGKKPAMCMRKRVETALG